MSIQEGVLQNRVHNLGVGRLEEDEQTIGVERHAGDIVRVFPFQGVDYLTAV